MPAGYSGTPPAQKLGIKQGDVLVILHAPEGYDEVLGELPEKVTVIRVTKGSVDVILFFARSEADLKRGFAEAKSSIKQAGMIWVCWPKKSSRMQTDLSDNVVRTIGLAGGLVDVKVCAIDEDWSGLKFVRRTNDRVASPIGA